MKNIIKLIAILAMCFMVVGMLASCNKNEQPVVEDNDDNQTVSTEPYIKDGTYWVGDFNTGVPANPDNNGDECPNDKHDFALVCEHFEHAEDATQNDLYVRKCADCGYVEIELVGCVFEAKPEKDVAVTCLADGYNHYECRCGAVEERNIVKALGHTYDAFNKDDLTASKKAGWELVPAKPNADDPYCPCEVTPVYVNTCERCGVAEFQNGKVPGHVWGEYYTALQQGNPCELPEELKVAKCTVCNNESNLVDFPKCAECLDQKVIKPAPGHDWGEWYWIVEPTKTTDGQIGRDCKGRDGYDCDGHDTKVVPAYNADVDSIVYPDNTAAYEYSKEDPTCVDAGKHVFVYKVGGKVVENAEKSTFEIEIPAGAGHDIRDVKYAWVEGNGMPTATDRTGKITVGCKNCDAVLEFTITLNDNNITKHGDCGDPVDTYTYVFSGKDDNNVAIVGSVKVEFTVEDPDAHPHSVGVYGTPDDPYKYCIPVEDEDGRIAYVVLCHNSDGTGCDQYIVVGYKDKK